MASSFPLDSEANALAYRVVSILATLLGTITVSFCLGQRTYTFGVFSRRGLSSMTLSRFWLLFLLIDSLFFLVGSGILLSGIGLIWNPSACNVIQLFCISFYFISKGAAYALFLEKVYAVWPNRGSRLTSTAYKVGLVALIGFLCLLVVFLVGRETRIRDDGQCVIGSHNSVTLAVLLVDIGVNVLLTSLFLVPLMRHTKLSPQVRQVAVRNLIASTGCFLSSVANLAALAALHGHEVAWVCVASCSVDITINAVLAFWVTRPPTQSEYMTGPEISASVWRATRNMDADEAILSRFDRKSLHIDLRTSNDRYASKRGTAVEHDSYTMHQNSYRHSDTKSLPPLAFPLSSHARSGSTTRPLSPPQSGSVIAAPLSPVIASAPSSPSYANRQKFSFSKPRAEDSYQNIDAQDGNTPMDKPTEDAVRRAKDRDEQEGVRDEDKVLDISAAGFRASD